jgi:S-adenosylmethionine synthetase
MAPRTPSFIYTSESVTEGHPDKVCDFIADSILDAHLRDDPQAHVACEVLCKANNVVLAGEITSNAKVDYDAVARLAIARVGYVDESEPFAAATVDIRNLISTQSSEINQAVGGAGATGQLGAGDQGMMMGYATNETAALMPLPIFLAHRLSNTLACDRKDGRVSWLRPDGKTQVTVSYQNGTPERVTRVVVSTQHAKGITQDDVAQYVRESLAPRALGDWFTKDVVIAANPSGSFVHGGPSADCGVTGRKIIVDTYGGLARHGGGAFSGKDPTKVDRSGAYFCRFVARSVVAAGLAKRAEVSVAYAIGLPEPMHVSVNTFGTGDDARAERLVREFDFRPGAIIERLDLRRPIYAQTTNYGHFGRPGFPWEALS